jgi:RND family efflux transporter MFP subunit
MESKTADLSSLKIDRSNRDDRPSNKVKHITWVVVLLILIIAAMILYPMIFTDTIEVNMTTAVLQSPAQSSSILTASGYVVAQRKAAIASKGTGRLVYLGVVEGDKVRKDQIIGRLEDSDIKAQLNEAKANLKFYEASLNDVENKYNRQKELLRTKVTSQEAYEQAEAEYKRLLASIDIAKAKVEQFEVAMENTLIRAPFDGTVLTKNAEVGEIVAPFGGSTTSKTAVVTIADMKSLLVEADVSESNIERIKADLDCEIVLDAYPEKSYPGYVFKIVPTADRSKATVMVKVGFKNYDDRVLPEMSAKVSFLSEPLDTAKLNEEKALVIPKSAIRNLDGSSFVYKIQNDEAVPVSIKTGRKFGNYVEVISGLENGDNVIDNVDEKISAGTKVKIAK